MKKLRGFRFGGERSAATPPIPLHRLAGMLYNRALAVSGSAALSASVVLRNHMKASAIGQMVIYDDQGESSTPRASTFLGERKSTEDGYYKPYPQNGSTAIIEIVGDLVNRGAWVGADCGLISYDGLKYQITEAIRDPDISAILFDVESPGGEVFGCFELSSLIREAREIKPCVAVVNGMACSAAYAIASSCSKIITTPSGISGSVGVVMLHIDFSKMLEIEGVHPTLIYSGGHKVDGHPFGPLPDDVMKKFQAEADSYREMFVSSVAEGRPSLSADAVRATEANVYIGEAARSIGLVDDIGTAEEVLYSLTDPESRRALLAA